MGESNIVSKIQAAAVALISDRDLHSRSELLIQLEKLDQTVTTTVFSASNEANWWNQSCSVVLSAVSGWTDLQPGPSLCTVEFAGKESSSYLWYLIVLPCLHSMSHSAFWVLRCSGNQNWLKYPISSCQRNYGQITCHMHLCSWSEKREEDSNLSRGEKWKKGISGELINCHLRGHMLMAGEERQGKELRPHGKVNTYSPYLTLIRCKFLEAKTVVRSFLYPRV